VLIGARKEAGMSRQTLAQRYSRLASIVAIAGLALVGTAAPVQSVINAPDGWSMGGQNYQNTRSNSTQTTLSTSNASRLGTKWTFDTHGDVSATPAVVGGAVYFPDWAGYLYKVNAKTGDLVWEKKLSDYGYNSASDLASRTAPAVVGNTLYIGDQGGGSQIPGAARPGRVLAIDTRTGALKWSTSINPSFFTIITQAPVVRDGVVYVGAASSEENAAAFIPGYDCCFFRGSFSALDAATGQILWTTYMVPDQVPGQEGRYSGGAVWGSTPALDPKSNTVYVTTGNNYSVPVSVKECQEAGGTPSQCLDPNDHIDAIVALDMTTGQIKWATGVQGFDDWIVSCIPNIPGAQPNCPPTPGPDYDFGSGANLLTAKIGGKNVDVVGAGAKSGIYWALKARTGEVLWGTEAGPGSTLGGIEWGTATDGKRIYIAEANNDHLAYPSNPALPHYGSFAALDPATGAILWQTPDPSGGVDLGAVSTSNGLVFGGSMSGHMFVFDAATGAVLKDLVGEGSSNAGPAIDDGGRVYWGNGYARFGLGTPSTSFYAFSVDGR
jgi:polyvinyl alcohol dehydrogenase (cytochrome)